MKNEKKLKKEGYNSLIGARRQKPLRKIKGKRQKKKLALNLDRSKREKELFEKFCMVKNT